MKRSRLKNKTNKTGSKEDLKFYIIQRHVVNFKHFGIYWNPYFKNKDTLNFFISNSFINNCTRFCKMIQQLQYW